MHYKTMGRILITSIYYTNDTPVGLEICTLLPKSTTTIDIMIIVTFIYSRLKRKTNRIFYQRKCDLFLCKRSMEMSNFHSNKKYDSFFFWTWHILLSLNRRNDFMRTRSERKHMIKTALAWRIKSTVMMIQTMTIHKEKIFNVKHYVQLEYWKCLHIKKKIVQFRMMRNISATWFSSIYMYNSNIFYKNMGYAKCIRL